MLGQRCYLTGRPPTKRARLKVRDFPAACRQTYTSPKGCSLRPRLCGLTVGPLLHGGLMKTHRALFDWVLLAEAAVVAGAVVSAAANDIGTPRFHHSGRMHPENPRNGSGSNPRSPKPQEAPTGFDNVTNGFTAQGPRYESINEENVRPLRSFNDNRFKFEEVETIADGLGPTYNAQACRECHENVVTGGASQVAEHRTGRVIDSAFQQSIGGTLIQSRATYPDIVERVAFEDDVRTFRISTNTLGDGYVEAIADETLLAIRDAQPAEMRGTALMVPVLEGDGSARIGRFG